MVEDEIAGMEGVDKEKVQRIVYEMSKGSKYFENEERKEAYMKQKIDSMRVRCAKLTAEDLSHYQKVLKRNSDIIICFFFFFPRLRNFQFR